jgi:hypothetical protein
VEGSAYSIPTDLPAIMAEEMAVAMIESLGGEYHLPIYAGKLQPPRPFLVPSLDDEPVEILPSPKITQKIRWAESILIKTIDNRFADEDYREDDEEASYEIEIVAEGDDDADFYLEIVDGEVFYVFETEDDSSQESGSSGSEEESLISDDSSSESDPEIPAAPAQFAQFSIPGMQAPDLEEMEILEATFSASGNTFANDNVPRCVGSPSKNSHYEDLNESFLTMGESFACLGGNIMDVEDAEVVAPSALDTSPKSPARCASPWDATMLGGADEGEQLQVPQSPVKDEPLSPFKSDNGNEKAKSPPKMPKREASIKLEDFQSLPFPSSPPKDDVAPLDAPPSPSRSVSSVKSILKANPESPPKILTVPDSPRRKKKKDKVVMAKKTFSKTYVRAEEYDGEHRVYAWEKPQWTNSKLKSTGQGENIRQGGNLASPITHIEKKINADADEDPECEKVDKEELIRRLAKGGYGQRGNRKLKFSLHGAKIRDGGDIVQPITKATVFRKRDDVNLEANPATLKTTAAGQLSRAGNDLAGPITQATVLRKAEYDVNHIANKTVLKSRGVPARAKSYEWEKPEWTSGRLRPTRRGQVVKDGGDVAQPITHIPKAINDVNQVANPGEELKKQRSPLVRQNSERSYTKTYTWEKPSWAKVKLGSTEKGEAIKSGKALEKPITFPMGKGGALNEATPEDGGGAGKDSSGSLRSKRTLSRSSSYDH